MILLLWPRESFLKVLFWRVNDREEQEAPDHKKTARCAFDSELYSWLTRWVTTRGPDVSAGLILASVFIFSPSGAFDRQKQTRCWLPERTALVIGSLTTDQTSVVSRTTFLKVSYWCFWCVREGLEIQKSRVCCQTCPMFLTQSTRLSASWCIDPLSLISWSSGPRWRL